MNEPQTDSRGLVPGTAWPVDALKKDDLYFYLAESTELLPQNRVRTDEHGEMVMLGSYSYLGLIGHPRINEAAKSAIDEYGTGTHGVRLLAGSLPIHTELELQIAKTKQTESSITFSSGYATNVAVISALLSSGDVILADRLDHASIIDGCLLSKASVQRFAHNDLVHLERRLQKVGDKKALVIVDGVYSMDGDIADLPSISALCRQYGAFLMVDEAHSIGVLGKTGKGIDEHFGLPPDAIDIKMGTLSKAIPSAGGYVAGSNELIEFLRHEARAFIYSAAIPPPAAAAALEAFRVMEDEQWRVERLQENYEFFDIGLRAEGLDTFSTEAAIVPINCGGAREALSVARACQRAGVYVQAILPPVVPPETSRLRACVSAAHTTEDIERCRSAIAEAARSQGVI